MSIRHALLAALASLSLALPYAPAQPAGFTVSVTPQRTHVAPGSTLAVAVVIDHDPGFHTWPSADQDVLPPDIASFAIRTAVAVTPQPPGSASVGPIQWPQPHPGLVPDITGGPPVEVPLYQGRAVAYVPIRIAPDPPESIELVIQTTAQACDESSCLPPQTSSHRITLTRAPSDGEPTDPALFQGFDPAAFDRTPPPDATPQPAGPDTASEPAIQGPATTAPGPRGGRFLGIVDVPAPSGPAGLIVLALLAALGGFVLNLTPCVLPVIPIKMMAISRHAGSPGRSFLLGLWMALGVVAFWLALSLPVLLLAGFTDPSVIFGYWYVTLGIGLLIALMGLGIMGLFEIRLPQSVYALNPRADSPWGSFLFGVMTGVLGLPCFGFVAGGLLAGAATLPASAIVIIFLGLGVGMAAPYLLLSARPAWAARVPRTGPASVLVKQVMGFLLLAAASFFIAVGLRTLILDYPWLAQTLRWWVVAFFVVLGCGWMLLRTVQITRSVKARAAVAALALALAALFVAFAASTTGQERDNFLLRQAALQQDDAGTLVTGAWIEYTPDRLRRALQAGKVVVIDFTADWCINCKFIKATVLDRDPLHSRLLADDVVMLEADLTSSRAPGHETMRQLGQTGIPLLVVYSPANPDEPFWLANAYTGQQVVDVIDRAAAQADPTRAAGR